MHLEMNHRQAGLNDEVAHRAERLLRFAMSRFTGTVTRVKVTFIDVNGPKGGFDKRCRLTAKLKVAGQVEVQHGGHDYTEALSHCLDKLTRAIRRDVDRRRTGPIRKNRITAKIDVENLSHTNSESQA